MSSEIEDIRNAKPDYLTQPYIGLFKVVSFKPSSEVAKPEYKGSPFYEVVLELGNGVKHKHTLWRFDPAKDDAEKKKGKNMRIRMFLVNMGVDVDVSANPFADVIGKTALGAFGMREYIGKDKDGRPALKSNMELRYVNERNKAFGTAVTLGTLDQPLSPENCQKLELQQRMWDEARGRAPQAASTGLPPAGLSELDDIRRAGPAPANPMPPALPPLDPIDLMGPDDLPF